MTDHYADIEKMKSALDALSKLEGVSLPTAVIHQLNECVMFMHGYLTPNKWHEGAELALALADACERDADKYNDPDWTEYMKAEAQRHRERAALWERLAK